VLLGRITKFVAALLAAGMFVLPLSATAVCLAHQFSSNHSDQECSKMMSHGWPDLQMIRSKSSPSPCCQISAVPPILESSAGERLQRHSHAAQVEQSVAEVSAATLHRPAGSEPASPPTPSSNRALLCVFLI
jgi:hypothetical protein